MQSDGWHAYEVVHSDLIIGVACWAHVRGKFKDAEKTNKTQSTRIRHAVEIIQQLYKIEKQSRKNWLCVSQAGANASANLYSLIETAKANGLNEYDYLKWVFAKLPQAQTVEDFEKLLPWKIDKAKLVNWVYA